MIRILSALLFALASALCAAAGQELQLAEGAPNRHVVVPGDTLWGISATFLREPWRWPEIWRMNREQVSNPHRIYPGDLIVLERDARGNPRLRLQGSKLRPQIHAEPTQEAIPSIPPNVIRPFLTDALLFDTSSLDKAALIVATPEDRVHLSNGDLAYVDQADPKQREWNIFRKDRPLYDPDSTAIIGYEAFHLGTAEQLRPGAPATFEVLTAKQEIGRGDRLLPASRQPVIAYAPHKPDFLVDARVVSVYGGVDTAGRGSIVALNRGAVDGIEVGHVLAAERNRAVTQRDENDRQTLVTIPDQRVGLLFVFRTFDRLSYALVVQAENTIDVNDFARTP
ncbi:MAG TPA: LysM peptidoglycan-binding domain-containing protein [Accumulibacter sp.]|uniref:LysM peptidoglycan-binding domain-containing protein n=1 Tax=Accumulibacter sp. TaxID=2053492 RepID=UPI002CFB802D|nr:LysM peptidoglycan-binding domain-containing protein [Accumulibacter sp.]HMX67422.1 LysM peptidoglycan-binding domain-containing protein [Accumulibacter sp.]HNE41035.1 LysM peptidoglycan-binding domain-containing protein [Accumulibacter sp.]HNM63274.1 LysM peptidoglycan-binding domain-containing protein [Accumulibacter sp.]